MDIIDRKIIRELQNNARLSNQELAEKVNLSPSPCLRRVRRLEKSGVLIGYTAQVDQEQFGLPINAFVSIRLEKQDHISVLNFETCINDLDEVMECYLMTGSRDYQMRVVSAYRCCVLFCVLDDTMLKCPSNGDPQHTCIALQPVIFHHHHHHHHHHHRSQTFSNSH